ncbi:MAG: cytochrome c, partial [Beijerinckiaceae bacterium]|nr:cytochrome c [Beijerinckiaceae bacterium]
SCANRMVLFLTIALLAAFRVSSLAAADIETGKRISTQWCASCHLISPTQRKASTDAPGFASINSKRRVSEIKTYLVQSHPQMPNMSLTQAEIDHIIIYMQSLSTPLDPLQQKPEQDKPPKTHRGRSSCSV